METFFAVSLILLWICVVLGGFRKSGLISLMLGISKYGSEARGRDKLGMLICFAPSLSASSFRIPPEESDTVSAPAFEQAFIIDMVSFVFPETLFTMASVRLFVNCGIRPPFTTTEGTLLS